MSGPSDEKRAESAENGRRYRHAYQILSKIVDALEPVKKHSNEARDFWVTFAEEKGTVDVERIKRHEGYKPEDHPMFWLGHSYGIEAIVGYNAASLAAELSEEKLEAINAILEG
jgi:hypothetical protein